MSEPTHPTECDVIMKGGITSGVIYPRALKALSETYRFRGIGGTSAGAIGAACAAAAEFGRAKQGFTKLGGLPDRLGEGMLARLFQPDPSTKQLLPLLMGATGNAKPGLPRSRFVAVPLALIMGFPFTAGAMVLAVAAFVVLGIKTAGWTGPALAVLGIALSIILGAAALAGRAYWQLAHAVPANLLGICRGLSTGRGGPGFTDWLSDTIDDLAGLEKQTQPLTFGDLWGAAADERPSTRAIDLRMVTTCISRSRPYEMPWASREFFYDPAVWRTLFPAYVMDALEACTASAAEQDAAADADVDAEDRPVTGFWAWADAAAQARGLRRLPGASDLPVIVATRMSLSFPLLISAVPLWSIDLRSRQTCESLRVLKSLGIGGADHVPPDFDLLWFTDGGLCSNFPVHMFDSPLPSRPTFAINLGRFSDDQVVSENEEENIEIARTNNDGLLPTYRAIDLRGIKAVTGFAGAALDTIRSWQDNSYLDAPGHRDRIVRVLQTKEEGGLNLYMLSPTITGLAARGQAGAEALIDQFTQDHYKTEESPTRTGWDNHRWIRYRALMASLPDFLTGYSRGKAVFDADIDPADPPSYAMNARERRVAAELSDALDDAVAATDASPDAVAGLKTAPARAGTLRRTPRM